MGLFPSVLIAQQLFQLCLSRTRTSYAIILSFVVGRRQHLSSSLTAKITIPAVKITGAVPSFPILPDDEELLAPEPCLSAIKLEPIDSTLFPCPLDEEAAAVLSTTDEEEDVTEFGEFLLDAVDWL
jgi:hypothetical protein